MQRHPIDPASGALGVLAVVLGILVGTRSLGGFDASGGWWLVGVAVVVGVALLPWNLWSARHEHEGDLVSEAGPELAVGTEPEAGEDAGGTRP
jgi:hypothetical protein